ncbi:Dabb family protein [Mycobacterium koreense]|uniref:Stress responsive protein n=1 Tax=Mycolicibacillus koreensis TaxID=1069220 RepID=A0A7I7SHK2_9MYCO|nr:Dabb family protein [Mycolicibacillus koreensis]MCV7250527.1 Dabb family protein [Mycolicibacillus koreensis]ODR04823.1 stress responsive protein [Mycolicibacillus koreensis]OSC32772.1 stress responsive protein [Mycolicibacillus koreensis]BBY56394.1 stress responsive protein [Mycolicibacillus koreensis]
MFSVTRLVDVAPDERQPVLTALSAAAERTRPRRWLVAPTNPSSRNGGDILVHLRFDDADRWQRGAGEFAEILAGPAITRVNGATYRGTPTSRGAAGTVYRTLLLRVHPGADAQRVRQFEQELAAMADFIGAIRAWQLSTVIDPVGATPWTHVFEQEFADAAALTGSYLMHPIHWASVDRWFDPETPDVIVFDRVCHSFCAMAHPVLS